MKIKFCGAAREVTGSAHLITLDDGFKILLDCGLYQGGGDDDGDDCAGACRPVPDTGGSCRSPALPVGHAR